MLRFDQTVTITTRAIEVFTADGHKVSGPAVSTDGGRGVRAALSGLKRGEAYTVRWRATSADGHTGSGVYTFGIGVTPPPPTEAYGSTGPGWADDAARWAFFVALALLLGTTGFRLLVLREPLPPRLSNRLYGISAAGGIAVLNVGIAAFVLRASEALRVPFVDLMYGDLSPLATKTRFGVAFVAMTLGYAVVTALVLLAWILDLPRLLWPAFLVGIGFATGLSLSGHQGVEPNSTFLTGLADYLHLVAAILWVGGLVALATCVWPLAPDLRRRRIPRLLAHRDRSRRRARAGGHVPLALAAARALGSLDDELRACADRRRSRSSASPSAGGRCTTSSSHHGSSGARCRALCAGA